MAHYVADSHAAAAADENLATSERPSQLNWMHSILPGVVISIACGAIYLASRPPLFDYDGYMYRFYVMQPDPWHNINPHHILWNPIQILIAASAALIGYPSTIVFQVVGILIGCTTLTLFYMLLRKVGANPIVACASVVLVAMAPAFWFLTLQNHPYPLVCLFLIVYLQFWTASDTYAPTGRRLAGAAVTLATATLLHQAVVFLIPPAVLALALFSRGSRMHRLSRALIWGSGVSFAVLGAYLFVWFAQSESARAAPDFLHWVTSYAQTEHPLQLFQLGPARSFARSIIGLSRSLFESDPIQSMLADEVSVVDVFLIYGFAGLVAIVATVLVFWRIDRGRTFGRLLRTKVVFAVSLLSACATWIFAFSWEAATAQYWLIGLFPALLCLSILISSKRGSLIFAAFVLILSTWNLHFDRLSDRLRSLEFPDPMLQSINDHIGSHDIFLVLGDGGYGDTNYDLLIDIMNEQNHNPAVLILNDFVLPAGSSENWQDRLAKKIESTLAAAGKVYIAGHIFDQDSYQDLAHANDAFNEQVDERYLSVDGSALYDQVQEFFRQYTLKDSGFAVGTDRYLILTRNRADPDVPSVDSNDSSKQVQDIAASQAQRVRGVQANVEESLAGTRIAITIDDIPDHGDLLPDMSREDIARGMVKILDDNDITRAYGFSNGDFMRDNPQELAILKIWLKAGHPLGNHTYDHADLNRIGAKAFIGDIAKQDRLLATLTGYSPLAKERHVFRYPYMDEGNTLARRDEVRRYLATQGYQIAEVTADYDDWAWTDAYSRCRVLHDGKSIAWLKDNVIQSADERLRESNLIAERLFGRRIAQILLIHDGSFDVLTLDGILKHWRARGVEFISLKDALDDPVYKFNPNVVYNDKLTFLKQIAKARRVEIGDLEEPAFGIDRLNEICKGTAAVTTRNPR